VFSVLGRHTETGEVSVAVRDSRELEFRGLSFVSSLVRKKVWSGYLACLPDTFPAHWCRMTRPGPRPLAGQDVDGAPGDADDVSRPGSDRWRSRCWLGS